jgi:O-antigen ligase
VFLEYPIFGIGLGGVGPHLHKEQFFPKYSGQIGDIDRLLIENFEPSNLLTEILGTLGIVGFILFSVFMFVLIRSIFKILRDPRLLLQERIHLLAFAISILVMLVCLQINQGLFRVYVWAHLGVAAGYVLKVRNRLIAIN